MDDAAAKELIDAWVRYHERKEASCARENDADFWAFEALVELTESRPEEAWSIILQILDRDLGYLAFGFLAAGPMEDLLAAHGDAFIERVEMQARRDPRFRDLLGGVWKNAMSDAVWQRVTNIAGPRW